MPDFVYPYNFVPPADQLPCRKDEYKPLHRYSGKTGRIEFTLINLSPLFVPDSEGTTFHRVGVDPETGELQHHRVMDFFNVDGRLAIPGTSLKGMVRAVAEALSNSSFGVFAPPEKGKKFTFRKTNDLGSDRLRDRKWGIWTGNGTIEELETAKIWRADFDAAFGLTTAPPDRHTYDALVRSPINVEVWQLHTGNKNVRTFSNGTHAGTVFSSAITRSGTGTLQLRSTQKPQKTQIVIPRSTTIKGPHLQDIRRALGLGSGTSWPHVGFQTVSGVPNAKTGVREERLCELTYQGRTWRANQGMKAAFLWPHQGWNRMEPAERGALHYVAALYLTGMTYTVPYPDDIERDYRAANKNRALKPGDIVRFRAIDTTVVELGPVAMFKTLERATIQEIAEQTRHLLPCIANNYLCPASRLFGWTPENAQGEGDENFPVAGRVRVSVAWSDKRLSDTRLIPLKILGSPKPQYYPFYLRPENGDPSSVPGYYTIHAGDWWPRAGRLRGRKFYLHHPDAVYDPQAPGQSPHAPASPDAACASVQMTPEMDKNAHQKQQNGQPIVPEDLRSHQNATAAVLPPGAEFKGYIEFDSLSDYELGLLLWAISLADSPLDGCTERAHKLGMGRPLGMGSVRLKIDRIVTWDPVGGWRDANDLGEQEMNAAEAARLVKVFKTWMVTGQETHDDTAVNTFNNEGFYRDLCEVLSLDLAGNDPVQYYPPGINAYEGYRYFMEQRKKRNRGQEQPLRTPRALRGGQRQSG
jgi:hypothetical protein